MPQESRRSPLTQHQVAWVHQAEADELKPARYALSSVVCRLPLDEQLLAEVVDDVALGFDAFRSSLDLEPGTTPHLVLNDGVTAEVLFHDLYEQPENTRESLASEALQTLAEQAFDMTRPPLVRVMAQRVDRNKFRISAVSHPALFGRRALFAFYRDLLIRYRRSLGETCHEPHASEGMASSTNSPVEGTPSVREWAQNFADFSPSSPSFWATAADATADTIVDENITFSAPLIEIPAELATTLESFSAKAGTSLSDVLMAAHAKAVSVASGRADIVVDVEGEDTSAWANGCGPTITTPVRIRLTPSTWMDLTRSVRDAASFAHQYRNLPQLSLRRMLDIGRLADSTFAYVETSIETDLLDTPSSVLAMAAGLQRQDADGTSYAQLPFSGVVFVEFFRNPRSRALALRVTAGEGLSVGQVQELTRLHLEVLKRLPHIDEAHKYFPTLPEPHRDLVLKQWNSDVRDYPVGFCVHELVEIQAARTPDAVAVVDAEGELTYQELNTCGNRLAHRLRTSGIGVGDIVGVCARRDASMVVSFLGVLKSGAAYLPLDPQQPRERNRHMIEDSGASVVLTNAAYAEIVPSGPWQVVPVDDSDQDPIAVPTTNLGRTSSPDDLMYVIYTSGSTGTPKGVEVPHSGVVNYLGWCAEAYASKGNGGAPVFSSVAFDMVVPNLYTPLIMGQRVCMIEESLDTAGIARRLSELAPFSFIKLTPGQLGVLSELLDPDVARQLAALLAVGADAFPLRTLHSWRRVDGETPILNEYGPTEASVGNSVHFVNGSETDELLPIGRAIPNTTMYVLDEDLKPVPIGVPGELYIGGACVVRGYRNRPELTAEKFIRNPFTNEPASRMYRTGDIGRWLPSGTLAFLGRIDDQVKIRGYRVEPAEVEAAISEHPDVSEAVVTVVGKTRETYALAGYYVGSPDLGPNALRRFLITRLPEYLVPSFLVPIQAIPLNANGKVDRKALPEAGSGRAARARQKAAATSEAGTLVRKLWQQAFAVKHVSLNDPVRAADGGIAEETQFALKLAPILGITVRDVIQAFVQARTIGELCERLATQPSGKRAT
ncbi:non-ribosomal peptide synthetase [Kibdelosporangium aridum]|uniref:non-ribosomal peptide synthetase n=1 Tax=Kibdelosporangium aridum TaxID=2030 RepID=UPI00068E22E6